MATSVDPEQKMEENEADEVKNEADEVKDEADEVKNEADSETDAVQEQKSERVTAIRNELEAIDQEQMPIAYELLKAELRKEGDRKSPPENPEFIRVDDKRVRISQKIMVPVEKDPEFNYVGKIVGKKGENMKQISSENNVKLAIKGKGSSKERDPEKEKELAESGKPEHEHLKEPLHVRIDTIGHPSKVFISMQRALNMLAPLVDPDGKSSVNGSGSGEGSKSFGSPYGGFEGPFGDYGFGPPMRGRGWGINPMMQNYARGMSGFGKARGRGAPWGRGRGLPY